MNESAPSSAVPSSSAASLSHAAPSSTRSIIASGSGCAAPLFPDFVLGGFECSCHRLRDGRRLDLLASTRHAELAEGDYARLVAMGTTTCRDGAPWVTVEQGPSSYDFSRVARMLHAADRNGVQVIWDLMHFGWPDDVDPFAPSFPSRFARYAAAFARWYASETDQPAMLTLINEMSFLAWAGGDVRYMNPFEAARGVELKAQLVRATIEAIEAVRAVLKDARFFQPEPVINILAPPDRPNLLARVESDNLLQYQALDMLTGRVWPSLGGHPRYLDIVGVNFYSDNQFISDGTTVERSDPLYKPFAAMLLEVWQRYERPMIVSETGCEGDGRVPWLRYVAAECHAALRAGCELHGLTLYPIINSPGWGDERHCHNGLWDYADEHGHRKLDEPFLAELQHQHGPLLAARAEMLARRSAATCDAAGHEA
ncbi:MAG: hypothetical protein JWO86_6871 [Myxococcaceae bacterium]|nr:hypothetical protein [Myxococcaceae bacterium]